MPSQTQLRLMASFHACLPRSQGRSLLLICPGQAFNRRPHEADETGPLGGFQQRSKPGRTRSRRSSRAGLDGG